MQRQQSGSRGRTNARGNASANAANAPPQRLRGTCCETLRETRAAPRWFWLSLLWLNSVLRTFGLAFFSPCLSKMLPSPTQIRSTRTTTTTTTTKLLGGGFHISPTPLHQDMISAAEHLSEDMTEQIRKIIGMENEQHYDRKKRARGGRPPLPAGAWAPPTLKDVCVCVFGLGDIGCPLVDVLVRSGLRNFLLVDKGHVRQADLICDVLQPAFLRHSKSQAVKLAMMQLDHTLSIESMRFDILARDGTTTLHRALLSSDIHTVQTGKDGGGDGGGGGGGGGGPGYKRKKIDLMVCCVRSREVRTSILHVCKSLSIPMMAVRSLEKSGVGVDLGTQGTVEFVLPKMSKLYEPRERGGAAGGDGRADSGEGGNNGGENSNGGGGRGATAVPAGFTPVSAKLEPLGLMLAGIGANALLRVIMGEEVPTFLRYNMLTGTTSTRLPRQSETK